MEQPKTKTATIAIILAVFVGMVAWDIVVASNKVSGDTISEITLAFSLRCPFVAYAIGFICGHLFWPRRKEYLNTVLSLAIGLGTGIIISLCYKAADITILPIVWLPVGVVVGHFVWNQRIKT